MSDALIAETITITSADGTEIEAYSARGVDEAPRGGVVVIHHAPGYDDSTKEIVRRFAAEGYNAVMPNLYCRQAPGASVEDAMKTALGGGGITDEQLADDVAGGAGYLKGLPNSDGKVGTIGYCSGGRQSFFAATSLQLDAAVDCYGAFVTGTPPENFPIKTMVPIVDRVPSLSCPLLGLFGEKDAHPNPAEVDELEEALKAAGKTYEFHRYPEAGHSFFTVDRAAYSPEAATDGWQRILAFYGKYLSA
jgi:carboxymethylenebutenolidase